MASTRLRVAVQGALSSVSPDSVSQDLQFAVAVSCARTLLFAECPSVEEWRKDSQNSLSQFRCRSPDCSRSRSSASLLVQSQSTLLKPRLRLQRCSCLSSHTLLVHLGPIRS